MPEIPLRQGGRIVATALVDDSDYELLMRWRWALNDRGYAQRSTTIGSAKDGTRRRVNIRMHRQIMGLTHADGIEVDHINCKPLDNRRSNLRVTSHAENHQNRARGYGTSQYRGVGWNKSKQKWRAWWGHKHLGYFTHEEDAARVAAEWRARNAPFSAEAGATKDSPQPGL